MTITQANDWQLAGLQENPFSTEAVYNDTSVKLVWAGLPTLRKQFETYLQQAAHSSVKQVILNFGPYGGGKTHAAQFFSQRKILTTTGNGLQSFIPLVLKQPKEPEKGDKKLYLDIIERLGFDNICEAVRVALSAQTEIVLSAHLNELIGSEDLSRAIMLLGQAEDENSKFMLRSYFLQHKSPRADLRMLKIARNIESIEDRFGVLAAIIQLMIGLDRSDDPAKHSRIMIWIDEMEDLILYPVKYHRPFTQSLRDLLGKIPRFFTLMMNFTLASPEALEDIELVLGSALLSRVTGKISFSALSYTDAYSYVLDLMRQYRPANFKNGKTYPFTESGLKQALGTINEIELTPREINKRCHSIIVSAIEQHQITSRHFIDTEFVGRFDADQLSHEV